MRRSFIEWAQLYEKKSGEEYAPNPGFTTLFQPDKGFCEVKYDFEKKMILVFQLCGNGKFWKKTVEELARRQGFTRGGAIAIRNLKPYIRLWGFSVVKEEPQEDGTVKYTGVDKEGNVGTAAPYFKRSNGEWAYYVIWNIKGGGDNGLQI